MPHDTSGHVPDVTGGGDGGGALGDGGGGVGGSGGGEGGGGVGGGDGGGDGGGGDGDGGGGEGGGGDGGGSDGGGGGGHAVSQCRCLFTPYCVSGEGGGEGYEISWKDRREGGAAHVRPVGRKEEA